MNLSAEKTATFFRRAASNKKEETPRGTGEDDFEFVEAKLLRILSNEEVVLVSYLVLNRSEALIVIRVLP